MSASLDPATVLTRFIDDEDAALAAGRQGKFWSSNHHDISPLIAKADRLLDPAQQVRLYGHVLRVAGVIPAVSEKEFPLLVEAYRAALPQLDSSGIGYLAGRLPLLFCFGFDELGALRSGQTTSAADLKTHLKLTALLGESTRTSLVEDMLGDVFARQGALPRHSE